MQSCANTGHNRKVENYVRNQEIALEPKGQFLPEKG